MALYELIIVIIGFVAVCGYNLRKEELKERKKWERRYSLRRGIEK